MNFYEVIYNRKTVRKFLGKPVDLEIIKRILEAGNAAPTWNHTRDWSYIILRTDEEKAYAFESTMKIADRLNADKYLNTSGPYPTALAQKMYAYAMPRQYTMLKDAPYVIIPVFKSGVLNSEHMSYGTLSKNPINHYNKIYYTIGRTTFEPIHVFKTNPNSESIAPAVCLTDSKKHLSEMNPPTAVIGSTANVMAKTNGNVMASRKASGTSFYGIYYVNNELYQDGESCNTNTVNCGFRGYPCFCIKNDGSVVIRWFETNYKLSLALPYCESIIAGSAALVFDSQNVFEGSVQSSDNHIIYNEDDPEDPTCHYNSSNFAGTLSNNNARTFLGHKSDGSFLMVVCESISILNGAKLMCDLGCDYAINLDGSTPSQMRVANGYLNNVSGVSAGKVTTTGSDNTYYGTAVVAYKLP